MVIVLELRHRQEVCPVVLPFTSEQPEVLLEFLIYPFRLTIRLQVVGYQVVLAALIPSSRYSSVVNSAVN
jgi:hypothetical protein